MAFTALPSGSLDVGDPIKKEIFDTIRSNEIDLDSRITDIEVGAARVIVFDDTILNAASASTLTGINYFRALQNFTLTGAEIQTFEHGSLTGTLQVDVKRNTTPNNTGMVSVFTTKPSIAMAAADYSVSTNQVFSFSQVSITAGTILRLDVTSMPTNGTLGKFRVQIYGEVT